MTIDIDIKPDPEPPGLFEALALFPVVQPAALSEAPVKSGKLKCEYSKPKRK